MDVSWGLEQLLLENSLPEEIRDILHQGSDPQYIGALSALALTSKYTETIFITHEPIFVEICSRWLALHGADHLSALAAVARILPSMPQLSLYVKALISRQRHPAIAALVSRKPTALYDLSVASLEDLLLALYRLLIFDNEEFAPFVSPAQMQVLLTSTHRHIKYLSIRILCLYLHASDAALEDMVTNYIGQDDISGQWEDKTVDYTFFSLWEGERLKGFNAKLHTAREARRKHRAGSQGLPIKRVLNTELLSETTGFIGGVLVPKLNVSARRSSSLLMTKTLNENMRLLVEGVNASKPLLVTGLSGAGKTALVREVARELGKDSEMVTLHLNDQTDAKLLIGLYTSAKTPGSFSWCPGVLTTAVVEGRWVIIEDLDHAPPEIISTLLPLVQRHELFIPNWGETVHATPGFKLIATVRSTLNIRGELVSPITNLIGKRHWLEVPFQTPSNTELAEIIAHKHPVLLNYIPRFMDVYHTVFNFKFKGNLDLALASRSPKPAGIRDLLKWCKRAESLLLANGIQSGSERISDTITNYLFLEAVECFLGSIPSGPAKDQNTSLVAQALHVPFERAEHCLKARKPEYWNSNSTLRIGRTEFSKNQKSLVVKQFSKRLESNHFAVTSYVLRILESVAVAIKEAEPCLLVGETGAGKTTVVQRLADALGQNLIAVNLSQQSEAGDLLGGYKPVNLKALAVPMKDEFDSLLETTFPSKRNQRYIDTLRKAIAKSRWSRALTLWQEALRMIESRLKSPRSGFDVDEPQSKKRKLQSSKEQELRKRWDKFASDVQCFQLHLASGSRGFAFSFVEGNIVKAARRGDWVLLDEINLASPDTLESLADLISDGHNGSPSILLTETGNTERVYAHRNFRVFGAMNPATDVGKRDLPTSLRSKFTEIFIEAPDKDFDSLVPVVKIYLDHSNYNHLDVRAATDVTNLYLDIKAYVHENKLVDGANQKPHFSLRTLARTLVYALDIAPVYGLRRALFEGFAMSFLTVLNRESELLLRPSIEKHILGAQKNSRASLHQTPRLPQGGKHYVQFRHYWMARGPHTIEEQAHYIITPFIERNLLNLVRATSTRRFPVLLQGPTSSGKTSMIEYLARISGNKFVRINNHEHMDLQEYLGTYVSGPDGRLQYQEGVLVQALREGNWVVLDELNLAPTDVLEALNRLLDDNRELLIPETQELIRPHENFMLFATQNPPGMYGGRKVLSRAFRSRFLELHFDDVPEDELETILRERTQIAPSFCTRIVSVYKKLSVLRQSERLFEQKNSFATLRDLFRWALRDADDREQLALNGYLLLAERVRKQEERSALRQIIEDVMKVKIDDSRIYGVDKLEKALASAATPSSHGIVWTKSARRLYILATEALKNNEPILLVGETGSGKTTMCQVISELSKTKLHVVNAHQNMEAGDLVGAQRPTRNRSLVEAKLAKELAHVLMDIGLYKEGIEYDTATMLEVYDAFHRQDPLKLSTKTHQNIEKSRSQANALFEWADGSLVQAMRNGHHFLLDEISLADDSVLERLNSILEPARTLLLAEKGSNDIVVQASPGFQFMGTMNPGGDYGKRELSPALRNRFTEIWVPTVSGESEMLEIAHVKLTALWSEFSKPMVNFAAWYAGTYSVAAPHISIRDLLAWIEFVKTCDRASPYLALLHGAAMVYIDCLGANSASKVTIDEAAVSQHRRACLLKFEQLFGHNVSAAYNATHQLIDTKTAFGVDSFCLQKHADDVIDRLYSLQAPTTLTNIMKIIRALLLKKPILLEGNPGVGKTTLVAAIANAIGIRLTRINLSDQTDLMDLFGSDVPIEEADAGRFGWRDAPFLRAMQNGEWVLLDEMNLASQAVLEGLNACLDHRGQVYVSELDKTFLRHPNFVVFAAQNPHHQGGGRKGLPTSFVDRFTVVYADGFTPDDLLVICREIHPDLSVRLMKKVINTATALDQSLRQNPRVGVNGGPWEINLRDILRWLHLSSFCNRSITAREASQYQDLLFLQRFRTADDVIAVQKILEAYLPSSELPLGYFHGKSKCFVEVRLGFLSRDNLSKPIAKQPRRMKAINLPIAESVMLCVQNTWPCLLVGASGLGKSDLILQIATSVGADVVTLSLNSEIDTSDLVGGYEQLDPLRVVTGFITRLRNYTRRVLMQLLQSINPPTDSLIALMTRMQNATTGLPDLMELSHRIAEQYPNFLYRDFVNEGSSIIQKSSVDHRARFEWVDGILVKALKQGKWLILENANLCSPSVLDRMNSLLEPNGFLSINEHRNADGSARIVKPHPAFRLFLTMDPRHGELSRAMRNRSIELFVSAQAPSPKCDALSSTCEPAVSRFELFNAFEWDNPHENHFIELLTICFDHLSFLDFRILQRWQTQVNNGLNNSLSRRKIFSSILKMYQIMSGSESMIMCCVKAANDGAAQASGLPVEFSDMQTIHPFNNPILLSLSASNPLSAHVRWLGNCFEFLVETHRYGLMISQASEHASSKPLPQMSRLERSLCSTGFRIASADSTQPVAVFLQDMGHFLLSIINDRCSEENAETQHILPFAKETLSYIGDILDLVQSSEFSEGDFQAYQRIGRSMIARECAERLPETLNVKLAHYLASRLDTFNDSWQLNSGLGMERIWEHFKPVTAANKTQLEGSLQARALADRFDALKWNSGASVQELAILRTSMARIHDTIAVTPILDPSSLHDASKALEDLEGRVALSQDAISPYFQPQFEILCQYGASEPSHNPTDQYPELGLLADRPTVELMAFRPSSPAWTMLSNISLSTGLTQSHNEMAISRGILPISLLSKLKNISEIPLRSLDLLRTEMPIISRTVMRFSSRIRGALLDPVKSLNVEGLYTEIQRALDLNTGSTGATEIKESLNAMTRHFHACLNFSLDPHELENSSRLGPEFDDSAQTAWSCVKFFTSFLLLYVPDRPLDPALKPIVERTRFVKRRTQLEQKLAALQHFETVFTGVPSSFRIRLVEQDLESMGAEPEVPPIVRPRHSELGQLQAEFDSILRTIVLKSPTVSLFQRAFQGHADQIQEIRLLRLNISRAVSGISSRFQAYEDITKPLISMLQGLDMGLALALIANAESKPNDKAIQHICRTTPFLGATPSSIAAITFTDIETQNTSQFDARLHFLETTSVMTSENKADSAYMSTVFQVFHALYREWKQKLGEDQQKDTAKSSLYRYRGSEEDANVEDEQDFRQLFPDDDDPPAENKNPKEASYDPRRQAQRLAVLQRDIFQSTESSSERILKLLRNSSQKVAGLWDDDTAISRSPVPPEVLLSGVVLNLENSDCLYAQEAPGQSYNFYVDSNILEVRKLVQIVQKLQARFRNFQEAWPEHATIEDVLRTSSQLLDLRHVEPLAKIMTKTEQLHSYVFEWQAVATKQFTAINLYEQLTDLLVSWRRLELSTWSQLLDSEDRACNVDADSWWFIAYDVIIAATLSVADAGEDFYAHAEQLCSTISEFLATTSIGQYSSRLGMIECFQRHLSVLALDTPSVKAVDNAVLNLLSYYRRFERAIQDSLSKGRKKLENDMKEVLLLASWKDTNIIALRDSAKRSHHKLFKIVRKYRALLGQPAASVLARGMPKELGTSKLSAPVDHHPTVVFQIEKAVGICQQHVGGWSSKPSRFTDPNATATNMLRLSKLPSGTIDCAKNLDSFEANLVESMSILQKETPAKATQENSAIVKHLKARKRKLFGETMRALRLMGFRSNLDTELLQKQSSLSAILANSPAFVTEYSTDELSAAENDFHKLLYIMPQIKERSRDHSEDLNHGDVSRSIGYLESMISVILQQRQTLASTINDLEDLENAMKKMQHLWDPDLHLPREQQADKEHNMKATRGVTGLLPGILEVGRLVISKHSKLSGSESSGIVNSLERWVSNMTTTIVEIETLPELPSGTSSLQHEQAKDKAKKLVEDLKVQLGQMIEAQPGFEYVVKQILYWIETSVPKRDKIANAEVRTNIKDVDDAISITVDSMLVAIQRMQESHSSYPSTNEVPKWLLRGDVSLTDGMKSLCIPQITLLLESAISKVRYLDITNEELITAGAICAIAMPIVQQYRDIQNSSLLKYANLHRSLCKLASVLAQSLSQIASEGFCSPVEDSVPDNAKTEKLEGGTGLGAGEGAEDISKDVQDDEDLSEMAQDSKRDKDKDEIEDQEGAVDMDHDELEGEVASNSDKGDEEGSASDGKEDDIDEEVGNVDDLDPSAMDEKLWEGKSKEEQKEKETTKGTGKAEKDDKVAADSGQQDTSHELEGGEIDDEPIQNGAEEEDDVARNDSEKIDPHAQEGQNLDLPEEMELDNTNSEDSQSISGDSNVQDMSDVDQQQGVDEEDEEDVNDDGRDGEPRDTGGDDLKVEDQTESQMEDANTDAQNEDAESPVDTDPDLDEKEDQGLLQVDADDVAAENDNNDLSNSQGTGQDLDQQPEQTKNPQHQAQGTKGIEGSSSLNEDVDTPAEDGQIGSNRDKLEGGRADEDVLRNSEPSKAFKKLGDALEKWHRQQRRVKEPTATSAESQQPVEEDVDMTGQDYEHLPDENAQADTQALDAASRDQATALNERALGSEVNGDARPFPTDEVIEEGADELDQKPEDIHRRLEGSTKQQEQPRPSILVTNNRDQSHGAADQPEYADHHKEEEDIDELDTDLSTTHLQTTHHDRPHRSAEEASKLWSHFETLTRDLSLSLTEQLRLILAPTLATKMRGDFRTGKRLNIKRVIPYIASQYKRDKIWMRRSIPTKRNYQIMLAVDDSKSMGESGSGKLAFETLALVTKSLSMLEAGELCIVGFGNEVHVAHEFNKPFSSSSDAGARLLEHFTFQQTKTNVHKLVADSISLFRDARRKSFGAAADLWQLELIISDGVCEDHDSIRRLVRQAQEERIMIIFVIVDTLLQGESIMDMSQAVFEPDDATGDTKLQIRRYLDGFPFPYYLVVGDVNELPRVLAQALRQWFAEVAESA